MQSRVLHSLRSTRDYVRKILIFAELELKPRKLFNEMLLENKQRNLSTAKFKRYTVHALYMAVVIKHK